MREHDLRHLMKLSEMTYSRSCNLKFRIPGENNYSAFGVVFNFNITKVHFLNSKNGAFTKDYRQFTSIEAMLDAGWEVD